MTKSYRYPADCTSIIDVTKAPYNADNTGKVDCTKILCQIVDDVLGAYEKRFYETDAKLSAMDDPNALISFEIRKIDGRKNVIFPEELPPSKIIYFPKGTYLVSDTISYSMEEFRNFLSSLRHLEMNAQLRFMGENMDETIIKLQDNCKGFEHGNDRPVISFMQGEASNIAMTNMLENLTISVGKGNPGATGVRYFANNTGAIRNVRIISEDPEFRGNTGFSVLHEKVSACLVQNVEIVGFNYGIKSMPQFLYTTFEHITLRNQKRCGIYAGNTVTSIRDLKSFNSVPVLRMEGMIGLVSLIDAELYGGSPLETAIRYQYGYCFLRNIKSEGYEYIMRQDMCYMQTPSVKDYLAEYCSHGPRTLFEQTDATSLNLPVEETPEVKWDDPEDWVSVNSFGAKGDGVTDDTAAIQAAMNCGKPTVFFNAGRYLIDAPIEIPAHVRRVNFMYGDLASGPNLCKMRDTGAFKIVGDSDEPIIIEDLFAFEKFFGYMTLVDHASKRTLIFSDVHVQTASIYFNTVEGGKVFMENTGCTIGGIPGAGKRTQPLPGEEKYPYDRTRTNFYFKNQTVYARQINPERSLHEVVNDGGLLWVMGCKTEEAGTAYETKNGGQTEVIGAVFAIGLGMQHPAVINDNSKVSVFASTAGMTHEQQWPIVVREIKGDEVREIKKEDLPTRYLDSRVLPLYIGK